MWSCLAPADKQAEDVPKVQKQILEYRKNKPPRAAAGIMRRFSEAQEGSGGLGRAQVDNTTGQRKGPRSTKSAAP